MKKLVIINLVGLILLSSVVIYQSFFSSDSSQQKLAYVDRTKLFQEFQMKKDLAVGFDKTEAQNIAKIDSLNGVINDLAGELKLQGENPNKEQLLEYNRLRNYSIELSKQLETDQQKRSMELTSQIWSRLNDYINQYGKSNGYAVILGVAGEGNVMYGNKAIDITDELLDYVNQKYEDS